MYYQSIDNIEMVILKKGKNEDNSQLTFIQKIKQLHIHIHTYTHGYIYIYIYD